MDLNYIRGFFDRLCSVDVANRAIVLTTDSVDAGRHVGAAVSMSGINCRIINVGDRVKLRISGREALEKWRNLIGFEDKIKAEKLNQILASYGGVDAEDPDA
jgi:hypothetical protein